jgi:uncharacterized protein (TIGR00369 family)
MRLEQKVVTVTSCGMRLLPNDHDTRGLGARLGFHTRSVDSGVVVVEAKVDFAQHANPLGWLHGGVIAAVADHAMGIAFITQLGESEEMTTIEMKFNLLAAATDGDTVSAKARVVKFGRTIGYAEAEVTSGSGKLLARGASTALRITK